MPTDESWQRWRDENPATVDEMGRALSDGVGETCMVPECDQPAVALLSNDEGCMSPEYEERWVCRWHRANPFPSRASDSGAVGE